MFDSKLHLLLMTFSDKDLRNFDFFLKSPYFNSNTLLQTFFANYKMYYLKSARNEISIQYFYEITFNEHYDDKKLKHYMNYVFEMAEQFLIHETVKENRIMQNEILLEMYLNKKLDKHFSYLSKKQEKEIGKIQYPSRLKLQHEFNFLNTELKKFNETKERKVNPKIHEYNNKLLAQFIYEKFKLTCEMIALQQSLNVTFEYDFLNELYQYVVRNNYLNEPLIKLYTLVLQLFLQDVEYKSFMDIKNEIILILIHIDKMESKNALTYIINYAIKKANNGEENYIAELFHLYGLGLKNKILFEGDTISPWALKNYVLTGIKLNNTLEIERELKDYCNLLLPHMQKNAFSYNSALVAFHKGDIDMSQRLLNEVSFDDIFYNMDTRRLLSKIFFEKKEFIVLENHIKSFKIFIQRNETISDNYKKSYEKFLFYLNKMMKANSKNNEELIQSIEQEKLLADKDWLLQKASGKK